MTSSCLGTRIWPVIDASGSGNSQKPIFVTMPKFDCENRPSADGPGAVLEVLPGLRGRQRAHAGAHHLAVGEHDLHAAVRAEVVAIRQRRAPRAVVERVADHAAPARVRAVDPELQLALANVAVEIEVATPGSTSA